jgi:hypothetical protein
MRKHERDDIHEALERLLGMVDRVDRTTELMQTVLMVREPNSTAAAEAYEGLRKQVVATSTERRQHLAQLAEFETTVRNGADAQQLQSLIDGWADQAGLLRATSAATEEVELLFDLTEDLGGALEVTSPAYLDCRTGSVVRKGRGRRIASIPTATPSSSSETEVEPATGVDEL